MGGFRKFNKVEKTEVLTPEQHRAAESALHGMGKQSASELSADERESFQIAIQSDTVEPTG